MSISFLDNDQWFSLLFYFYFLAIRDTWGLSYLSVSREDGNTYSEPSSVGKLCGVGIGAHAFLAIARPCAPLPALDHTGAETAKLTYTIFIN